MPRVQSASHLYLIAKRATTFPAAMPPVASFPRVASFSNPFVDTNVKALLVVGKKSLPVPHRDVISRCSSADPATSPSWDTYTQKILASCITSRVFRGFSSTYECSSVYVAPYSPVLPGCCVGRFSKYVKGCSDDRKKAHYSGATFGDEQGAMLRNGEASSSEAMNATGEEPISVKVDATKNLEMLGSGLDISGEAENATDEEDLSGKARGDRRRRGGVGIPSPSSPSSSSSGRKDLLTVPGIGPRYIQKLEAKGIAKLDELKQLYRDKYRSDGTEKMVEFLRSSVGVQKHHATSISLFIKKSVDAEEDGTAESGSKLKKRLTFCVEGNISVGKTTFLHRIANETIELRDLVEVVPEPIGKWQDVGPDHFNILDAFYGDPERYAYTFQNYVFVTRMMQERESAKGDKKLRLMERSVFSDRMVFVRAVHEAKWMSDAEISIYDSWFDPVVSAMPGLIPDAFIYLRATPDTCLRRLQSRKREEETNVTLDYLRGLHEKHEQWLFPAEHSGSSVLSVSEWPSGRNGPLSPRLQDRVLYLRGENVHSSIQKVPALVLDCEPSIDFSKDVEAKSEYARQVAEFFEYVQGMKDNQHCGPDSGSLLLPRGGLLGPDGNLLRPSSLEGVNLGRQVSNICG